MNFNKMCIDVFHINFQPYTIGICCFSTNHAALRNKIKDWLALNQNNVSEWSDMSTRGLLFQWVGTMQIQYKADLIIISLKINLFSSWHSWKIAELTLNNNHSLTHSLKPPLIDILHIPDLILKLYVFVRIMSLTAGIL